MEAKRALGRLAKFVAWGVGVPLGLIVISVVGMVLFGTDELTVQGDGSTIGATIYVDGKPAGTLVEVAGKPHRLPSTARAINGLVPEPSYDDKRPYTWLEPTPGYAECDVKVGKRASRVLFISARGDSLEAVLGYGGRGLVRVSFDLMAVQVLRDS